MYRHLEQRLARRLLEFLHRRYPGVTMPKVVIEQPPKVELGDFAIPVFPFAKPLRTAPLRIAEAIRAEIGPIEGIAEMQVAPPGYLNVRIDRGWMAAELAADKNPACGCSRRKDSGRTHEHQPQQGGPHRPSAQCEFWAIRLSGCCDMRDREVDVQNYIDNTGVQVADVVVGFTHIEKKSPAEIEALARLPRFDYYCWDLYARVSQWYEQDKEHLQARRETLHAIEDASSETAAVAELISTAVLRRHLETMDRLDIEYDFLPRESEILHLHFWDAAFGKLKEAGVLTYETEGKNKGCWVMRRAGTTSTNRGRREHRGPRRFPRKIRKSSCAPTAPSATSAKTSPITCGSSACWDATSAIASFIAIPISTSAGFPRWKARKIILTSETLPRSIT